MLIVQEIWKKKKQKPGIRQVASCNPDTCSSTKVCSPPNTNFSLSLLSLFVAVVFVVCLFVDLLQLRSLELSGHEILHLICGLACSSSKDKNLEM